MAIIQVDGTDFKEIFEQESQKKNVVILKFESMYCDSCIALGFELEELEESRDDVTVLEIDCGENEILTQMYDVVQVPTMIIFKNKKMIYNGTGVVLAADIVEMIQEK
ncbi:thioredoxin family protein [Sulfurimonas sp.]